MTKFFAHRGFIEGNIKDNSIESLDKAVEKGFKAIEFDIWLHLNTLIINHDNPNEDKNTSFPTIVDYFKYQNDLEYWLDFKNMDENNVHDIVSLLKKAVTEKNISLDHLYFVPFTDDYHITSKLFEEIKKHFGNGANLVALCWREDRLEALKDFMTHKNITYVSIDYKLLTQSLIDRFGSDNIYAWTIKDITTIKELEKLGIKNFATDNINPSMLNR